jgi:catechol 2,3-dioxygenase-like lactoylglutathione lyase family enzyme
VENRSERPGQNAEALDILDHVAIPVRDIAAAADWYVEKFRCRVTYQDDTWAFLEFGNANLALVIPDQHPPHVALLRADAEKFGLLSTHRDGTRSCYVKDPCGNSVEVMTRRIEEA